MTTVRRTQPISGLVEMLSLVTAGLAALALWSWGAGVTDLFTLGPTHRPMSPSTALLLTLTGWAVFFRSRWPDQVRVRWACQAIAGAVALAGLLTGLRPCLGWGSPLEVWLAQSAETTGNLQFGQMSALAGGAFFVVGLSWLLVLRTRQKAMARWLASLLLLGVVLLAAGVTASYAAGKPWFYDSRFIPMALLTALSFGLVGLALLGLCWCEGRRPGAESGAALDDQGRAWRPNPGLMPLTVFILLAGLIGTLSALYLRHLQTQDRADVRELLNTVANLKTARIAEWRAERLNDAQSIPQSEDFAHDAQAFLANPASERARGRLLRWMTLLRAGDRYADIAFVDTNATPRLSVCSNVIHSATILRELCAAACRTDQAFLSDLHRATPEGDVHLEVVFPVWAPAPNPGRGPSQALLGVLLLRLDPQRFLYPLLASWEAPSRSGETTLFRREGDSVMCLNPVRGATNAVLTLRVPLEPKSDLVGAKAILGQVGILEGADYRGVPVLAAVCPIPGSSWFLAAKLNREEVYAHWRRQAGLALGLTLVLGAVAGLATWLFSKSRESALTQRQLAAERQRLALAQRVEHLMKRASDAIILTDARNERIFEANDSALAMYGYTLVELQTLSPALMRSAEAREGFPLQMAELHRHGRALYETVHQRKDGSVFPVEVSTNIIDIDGVRYCLAFIRDITVRKSRDQELARLTRLYATLSALNRSLVHARSREELFQTACTVAAQHAGFKLAWIGAIDPQTQQVRPVARAGESQDYLDRVSIYADERPEGQGPAGRCIREQRACICNEFATDPSTGPWREAALACGLYAAAALPLTLDSEVCGAFVVYAGEPGVFQDKEIELLEEMALDISYALHHFEQENKRRQAEQLLEANEQRLRTIIQTAHDGFWLLDAQGRFLEVNDRACRLTGFSREELLQRRIQDLEANESLAEVTAHLERIRTRGWDYFQTRLHRKDGGVFDVELSVNFHEHEGGCFVVFCRDVTERKQAEAALQASEQRYRTLFEAGGDAIFLGDITPEGQTGNFIEVNELACQRLGYTREELLQKTPFDIDPHMNTELIRGMVQYLRVQGRDVFQTEHMAKDGRRIPVEISCRLFERDGKTMVLSIARDLTERAEAEAALRESERRFRDMMENVQLVAVILNEQHRILFCNEHLLRLTGWQREEVLGQDFIEVFIPAEEREHLRQLARSVLGGEPVPHKESEIITRKGERRLIAWNNTSLKNVAGQIVGIASIGEDITGRKQLEAQLRQAQKMEAIGQLAGGVAHDFNNILAATMLSLELLMMDAALSEETQQSLKELMAHAERAASLTRQLLLFSRRSVMQVAALDVNEVVEHLLKMLRRLIGEHIQLEWHAKSQLPPVMADAGMLEQVVMNLVVNARDAMAQGGQLTLATDSLELGPEQVRHLRGFPAARPGRFVCLSVTDMGCGMDDTVLKRIFEPFFTTKEAGKGTGLGLATVYGIVGQHQGWVTVESQVGEGSTFRVFLPAVEKPVIEGLSGPKAEPVRGGGETILLVEDDAAVRKTTRGFLQRWGYQVIEAENGVEALGLWQTHHKRVDLLLTDMVMPAGVSGLDLAERLRATKPELKVIISSGYSNELLQQGAAALKGIHYCPKPCPPAELAASLRRCLETPLGVQTA